MFRSGDDCCDNSMVLDFAKRSTGCCIEQSFCFFFPVTDCSTYYESSKWILLSGVRAAMARRWCFVRSGNWYCISSESILLAEWSAGFIIGVSFG